MMTFTDSTNHCRSDYTLGVAARILLLSVCDEGCGYSDHDIPRVVWSELGAELEAFLAVNAADLGVIEDTVDAEQVASNWIGSRNGDGIGFWSLACEVGLSDDEREALERLDKSAESQGECSIYAGDDSELYYSGTWNRPEWEAAYEAARNEAAQ